MRMQNLLSTLNFNPQPLHTDNLVESGCLSVSFDTREVQPHVVICQLITHSMINSTAEYDSDDVVLELRQAKLKQEQETATLYFPYIKFAE
jgi:hypothetical protein